jgi:hypothetical protein
LYRYNSDVEFEKVTQRLKELGAAEVLSDDGNLRQKLEDNRFFAKPKLVRRGYQRHSLHGAYWLSRLSVFFSITPYQGCHSRVSAPGCQISYMDHHTGCHQLND